jgi:uncharacterized pyridoxal phosphate-containing UPF0001 family protein
MREAARRANRAVEEITLVAVSKTHPAAAIHAAGRQVLVILAKTACRKRSRRYLW